MTQVRLEEILSQEQISNNELAEILGDMFVSFSKHLKDLKKEIQAIEDQSKLGFGIILEDEED